MYCINCGQQVDDKAVICPHCGVPIATIPAATPIPPTPQPMPYAAAPQPMPYQPVAQPMPYAPVPPPPMPAQHAQKAENTLAIVGFILAFFVPIAGLICSIMGHKKAKREGAANGGLAIAGIVISAVSLATIVLAVLYYLFIILLMFSIIWSYPPAVSTVLFLL